LCATLLLTACGGNDNKSTPTPTKPATTVAAPTSASGGTTGTSTVTTSTAGGGANAASTSAAQSATELAGSEATLNAVSTTAASFTGAIDACKLVSRKDAEQIIGQKLSGDPFHGAPGFEKAQFACNYNPASVPGTAVVDGQTVMLVAITKDDLKAFGMTDTDVEKAFADGKEGAKDEAGYTEVTGLGDDAYYTTDSGLSVRKGDKGITVTGLPLDKAKAFAKKALDNL
jgi:hypothetical protein